TADDAAAHVQNRLVGLRDQLGGLPDLAVVRFGVRLVAGQVQARRPAQCALALQHVFRDVDEDRSGATGGSDVERFGDHLRDLVARADQEVVLGDRHRDARDVGFLEGVGADQCATDLTGDGDDGDRVHLGIRQRRDQVRRAGARGRHAHTHPAGGVRVATGGVTGTLLVADQHVAQLLGVEQRVVYRQHRPAGGPEDDVDVKFLQRPYYRLRAGKLLRRKVFRLRYRGLCGGFHCVGGDVGRTRRLGGLLPGGSAHCSQGPYSVWESSLWATKNPRQLICCTRVARWCWIAANADVSVRHQRADELLRAFRAFRRYP